MQWEGQSRFLTVCPMRPFQLIFTTRAIECQEKWYPDIRESGFPSVYCLLTSSGLLSLARDQDCVLSCLPIWTCIRQQINMAICRPSLLLSVCIFPLTRIAAGFVDKSPATHVLSFHQLFLFRQRSVSEVGSSDIRKNDTGDRIASAALEKIIVLCFESYKNKDCFPCNKACGSFIPLHVITGQARQHSGYFSGSLIVLSPWFLEIDESGSSFISGHFKRH